MRKVMEMEKKMKKTKKKIEIKKLWKRKMMEWKKKRLREND